MADGAYPFQDTGLVSMVKTVTLYSRTFGISNATQTVFEVFGETVRNHATGFRDVKALCESDDILWVLDKDMGVFKVDLTGRKECIATTRDFDEIIELGDIFQDVHGGVIVSEKGHFCRLFHLSSDGTIHTIVANLSSPSTACRMADGSIATMGCYRLHKIGATTTVMDHTWNTNSVHVLPLACGGILMVDKIYGYGIITIRHITSNLTPMILGRFPMGNYPQDSNYKIHVKWADYGIKIGVNGCVFDVELCRTLLPLVPASLLSPEDAFGHYMSGRATFGHVFEPGRFFEILTETASFFRHAKTCLMADELACFAAIYCGSGRDIRENDFSALRWLTGGARVLPRSGACGPLPIRRRIVGYLVHPMRARLEHV